MALRLGHLYFCYCFSELVLVFQLRDRVCVFVCT